MYGIIADFGVSTQVPGKRNGLFSESRQNPVTRSHSKNHTSLTFHDHSKTVSTSCHQGMKLLSQALRTFIERF